VEDLGKEEEEDIKVDNVNHPLFHFHLEEDKE
jgi:hypothetical protein